jgi:hypothetical protein
LPLVTSCNPVLILLDFTPETDPDGKVERGLRQLLEWVDIRKMELPATHSNYMVQHCFLDALPDLPDDALVCLTDLDITIQRDFDADELKWMTDTLQEDDIGIYYNGTASDSLALEAERIGLSQEWIAANTDGRLNEHHCLNCGVMVARAGVFRQIQKEYESKCMEFYLHAPHRSRCQFLLNLCFWTLGLNVFILPDTVHQHGHFADRATGDILLPAGASVRLQTVMSDGQPVVFKHAFNF